jgi:hypothetical protein
VHRLVFIRMCMALSLSLALCVRAQDALTGVGVGDGQTNGLDQFCINLANERLQQFFVGLTFKQEQREYESEGIPWTYVDFGDNQGVMDLLSRVRPPWHTGTTVIYSRARPSLSLARVCVCAVGLLLLMLTVFCWVGWGDGCLLCVHVCVCVVRGWVRGVTVAAHGPAAAAG